MKKILNMFVLFFICFIMLHGIVQANSPPTIGIKSSTNGIKSGMEIEITLELKNFDEIEKGINAYKATLHYDSDAFEEVQQSDFTCLNGWESIRYNKETGEFVAFKKVGSKKTEEVLKVTLRLKENASMGETTIAIKDVVASEGIKDLSLEKQSLTVSVVQDQLKYPDSIKLNSSNIKGSFVGAVMNTLKLAETSNTDEKISHDNEIPTHEKKEKTSSEFKIPKTLKKYFWLFILLIIENIVTIVYLLLKRRRSIQKDANAKDKKVFLSFLIVGFLVSQCIITCYATWRGLFLKGELNADEVVDYEDVNLLALHLIRQQILPNEKLENADMNSDGKVTITDLSLLIRKLEKILNYEVNLSDVKADKIYVNKKETITVRFNAHVSHEESLSSIVVNGERYPVQRIGNSEEYTFAINAGDIAGKKEFFIKEVILSNGKIVKTAHTISIEVLKNAPTVENYQVTENRNDSKVEVSFSIFDKDGSITKSHIYIYNDKSTLIADYAAITGKNYFVFDVEDGKKYKAVIAVDYNLTTNNQNYAKIFRIEKELQLNIHYQFQFSDLKIYRNKVEVTSLEKEEPFQIGFVSSNATVHEPTLVRINGKVYQVTESDKENHRYYVTMPSYDTIGDYIFKIEALTLSNGHSFEIKENNRVALHVLKRRPMISNLKFTENIIDNSIDLQFDLQDEDQTLEGMRLELLNSQDQMISILSLNQVELRSGRISKTMPTAITEKYKIRVFASYRQNEELVEEQIFIEEMKAIERVRINAVQLDKMYYEKQEKAVITYALETNKKMNIKKIWINSKEYDVHKLESGKYSVTLSVFDTAGVCDLITSKIIFEDDSIVEVNHFSQIEILKDPPAIKNYSYIHEGKKATIRFDVVDRDESFIEGKLFLTKLEDQSTQELEIHRGNNQFTIELENLKLYHLEIKVSYDRDTNTLSENENVIKEEVLFVQTLQFLEDYKLQISDLKTLNQEGETKQFNKDDSIFVQFKSTNESVFTPKYAMINGKKYQLTLKNDYYQAQIDGFSTIGVHEILLEEIILNNGHALIVSNKNIVKVDILKQKPDVNGFDYQENEDSTISISFMVDDLENSLVEGTAILQNNQGIPLKEQKIIKGKNTITFSKTKSEYYTFKVFVSYNLSTDSLEAGLNTVYDELMLEEEICVKETSFEMADITRISLYKKTDNGSEEIHNLFSSTLDDLKNLNEYFICLEIKSEKFLNVPIRKYRIENGKVYFTIEIPHVLQYDENQNKKEVEVSFDIVDDSMIENVELETLLKLISKDPRGNYRLTEDIDASIVSSGTTLIPGEFTGTIDFDGHTIKNLSIPLFHTLKGATIKNLIIQDSKVTHGIFAEVISNSTVKNVLVKDSDISNLKDFVGCMKQCGYSQNISAIGIHPENSKKNEGVIDQIFELKIQDVYIEAYTRLNLDE